VSVEMFVCPADGPPIRSGGDALDLIASALEQGVDLVVVPVDRLDPDFFQLRTGVAGEIVQKFVNYRLRLAVVGDVAHHVARSPTVRDFVAEANRGRQLWFVASLDELADRLG
jgi:hypothetical protein